MARIILFSVFLLLVGTTLSCGSDRKRAQELARSDDPADLEKAALIYEDEIHELTMLTWDLVAVRAELGRRQMKRDMIGEAARNLKAAVQMRPTDAGLRLDLAVCIARMVESGDAPFEDAEKEYRAAFAIDPTLAEAPYGLANLYLSEKNDRKTAFQLCLESLKVARNYSSPYILAGRIAAEEGKFTTAANFLERALEFEPHGSARRRDIQMSYSRVLRKLGRGKEANEIDREVYGF